MIARTIFAFGFVGVLVAFSPSVAASLQPTVGATPVETQARKFVELLAAKRFRELKPLVNAAMNTAMSPEATARIWDGLLAQMGEFKSIDGTRRDDAAGLRRVRVTCSFERAKLDARIVYDADGLVAGIFFVPSGPEPESRIPPYADRDKFIDEETQVVTGEFHLPATLTIPTGVDRPPVVVLVHGSGPNDRDETIGPNKVFRDLAWGLATRGIASLRYEKRTKVYGARLDIETLTHREEVVDDALSAVRLLASDPRFDPDRIVLIGHSLGGLLAPLIVTESPDLDGVVIMAGATGPLLEIMVRQFEYIFMEDGELSDAEQKQIDDVRRSIAELKEGGNPSGILGGASKLYFDRLDEYDPLATVRGLEIPILVVQGERDYQVLAAEDYESWKRALSDRPNATFRLYADLDHLFMAGEGPSYPRDYAQPRNVSEEYIADVADWISESVSK